MLFWPSEGRDLTHGSQAHPVTVHKAYGGLELQRPSVQGRAAQSQLLKMFRGPRDLTTQGVPRRLIFFLFFCNSVLRLNSHTI